MRSPWATPLDRAPSGTPDEGGIGGFIEGAKILSERFALLDLLDLSDEQRTFLKDGIPDDDEGSEQ